SGARWPALRQRGVAAKTLGAAEVDRLAGAPPRERAGADDVRLAHRVLHELVRDRSTRPDSATQRRKEERDEDHHPEEERGEPHPVQRSGRMDTARRNSLSCVVSSNDGWPRPLAPLKKMPVSAPCRRIS